MVKGTSRRVIVVDSPDPNFFEQAIFIVKNDVFTREGVTQQQVLGEACRIARGYAQAHGISQRRKVPGWVWWLAAAGGCLAALVLLLVL